MNLNELNKLSLRVKKIIDILEKGDLDFINTSKKVSINKEFLIRAHNALENSIKRLENK